ncbi:MAG TPA: aldehyde dehydrogenase family protein, partial [Bacillota bacterium]
MEHLAVQHFIDGEPVDGGDRFPLIYPATGEEIGSVPEGGKAEVDAAVRAAERAFPQWASLPPSQRRVLLNRFADAILAHGEELGRLETLDVGRPIRDKGAHYIQRIAANIRFFADFAVQVAAEAFPMENGYLNYVLRRPVGVAALITPWNIPTLLATWKLGPALAFGNTVVLKPAEWTPVGAWKLAQLAHEAGLPPGVFNVVHGFGPASAGEYLTLHPGVRLISFTGEIATGKAIMAAGAPTLKRVSFELGGNGANIVFADADWERALAVSLRAAFFNQGEFCLSGARIFVEEPVYERFVRDFAARAAALKVGDPMDPGTEMGALITAEHMERVLTYVESARR